MVSAMFVITDNIDNCPLIANTWQWDSDQDGLGNVCDPDDDNDGLTDSEEAALGTNPLSPDTDGDGVWDGDEVKCSSNPLDSQSKCVKTLPWLMLLTDE